jgi:cholest-4-en-3-one 26-monooxygenase
MTSFRFEDPDAYVNGTPYPAFATLRRSEPFAWHPLGTHTGDGFWLAVRHADVVAISRNSKLFLTRSPLLADPAPAQLWPAFPALAMIADNLMTYDAHKHAVHRPIANAMFAAHRLALLEDAVRDVSRCVVQRVASQPRLDFAEDVSLAVAVEAILGAALGVDAVDLQRVARCVLTINAMDDPFFHPRRDALIHAAEELREYGVSVLQQTHARRADTILGDVAERARGQGVSAEQFFFAYWFPLAAGAFDTTASTIAGGVQALLNCPDQLVRLRHEPALISSAIDEMLRWVSPVVYFRRTASADVDYHGHPIKAGQKIVLCYASANRDEDVFTNPDAFDITRHPNNHVSFGYGPHFCLGARLASLVLRVFFEEALELIARIELDGPVIHTRSAWMNRIRSMPVRVGSHPRAV